MARIDTARIAADLEACRCREPQMQDALDEAGTTIADLRRDLDLARAVADALATCLRDAVHEADGLRLERDVAQQEAAERTAERDAALQPWEVDALRVRIAESLAEVVHWGCDFAEDGSLTDIERVSPLELIAAAYPALPELRQAVAARIVRDAVTA